MLLRPFYHLPHDFGHERLRLVRCNLHLLVADFYGLVFKSEVGDDAYAECLYAAMVGHDDLGHGAHAYGVASQTMVHLIFGRRLEGWALHSYVYSVDNPYALFLGNGISFGYQFFVISLVHIGETWPRRQVLSAQRVLREQVDVVCDNHQVANLEIGVHASGGVAYKESLDAKFVHNPYRERHFLHLVALVIVETALHRHYVNTPELAED